MAADEWFAYYKGGGMEEDRNIAPSLGCFCADLMEEEGGDAQEMLFATFCSYPQALGHSTQHYQTTVSLQAL